MLIDLTQFQSLIHKYCQDFSLDKNKVLHITSGYPHESLCRHTIPPRKTVCKVSLDINHPLRDWDPPCAWEGFAALDYEICGPMLDKSVLRRDEEATMRCVVPHLMPIATVALAARRLGLLCAQAILFIGDN